jgi:hypothetical protein
MPLARRLVLLCIFSAAVFGRSPEIPEWRVASEGELKQIIPARAPVEKERIETEFRTATGITNGKGKFVAAVLLITAGYSADGKYSHFFLTQVPLKLGSVELKPGEYALGWQRHEESLNVKIYDAQSGKLLGSVDAGRLNRIGRVESFRIYSPAQKSIIQIGRFGFPYTLTE